MRERVHFVFLNLGHFYDHLFMLVFATAAALVLAKEWALTYSELIPYATPGFVAFGVCSLPAGWLADKWSREGMMTVFFLGIGASALATAHADGPVQMGAGLLAMGVFAAIYHPVGLALVVGERARTGVPLAVNGIFGNMGVACAALLTGYLIDHAGWRAAFAWPGAVALATGVAYAAFVWSGRSARAARAAAGGARARASAPRLALERPALARVFAIIFFSTALGGLVFQSTTFALPKIFDERLGTLALSATLVGWYAFVVFAIAAFGQLVVGYLIDRFQPRVVFASVAALQALLFALMPRLEGGAALLVSIAFMLAVFGQIPINDVLIGRITRSEWRSRVFACRYIVTASVMASSVPLIAWVHAYGGFATLFAILAAAGACIFAAALMLPRALAPS